MTIDLTDQLRGYGRQIAADQRPITLDETIHSYSSLNGLPVADELHRSHRSADEYQEVDIMLMKDEQPAGQNRPLLLAVAAALLLVIGTIAALQFAGDENGSDVSTETDTPVTVPEPPQTTALEPEAVGPTGADIPAVGKVPANTTYLTELLGRPTTFFLPVELEVVALRDDYLSLIHDRQATENFGIAMQRVPEFFAGVTTTDLDLWPLEGIDGNDLDRWIAEANIIVSDDRQTTVDGLPARAIDFVVDAAAPFTETEDPPCPVVVRPCYFYSTAIERSDGSAFTGNVILNRFTYRFIHIPIAGEDPVLIVLWSVGATQADRIDALEAQLVSTIAIR